MGDDTNERVPHDTRSSGDHRRMIEAGLLRGRVTRSEPGVGVWVVVPSLGGMEVGPVEHDGGVYESGDRVVLGELDEPGSGLVVLGRVTQVESSGGGTGGPVRWSDIDGVPTSFPPSPHVHPVTQVPGLSDALEDLLARYTALQAQVDGLPSGGGGAPVPWQPTVAYPAGAMVDHDGYCWLAKTDTTPGETPAISTVQHEVPFATIGYNGLVNLIGTDFGTKPYVNPTTAGGPITTTASSALAGAGPEKAFDHSSEDGFTYCSTNTVGSWLAVDFGAGWKVKPTHVGLEHPRRWDGDYARNFRIQGSNNGTTWTDLLVPAPDQGPILSTKFWHAPMTGDAAYRHLRVLMTGAGAGGNGYLPIGELEFWGTCSFTPPTPDKWQRRYRIDAV